MPRTPDKRVLVVVVIGQNIEVGEGGERFACFFNLELFTPEPPLPKGLPDHRVQHGSPGANRTAIKADQNKAKARRTKTIIIRHHTEELMG